MPGYNWQRRDTARTLPKIIVFFRVLFVCQCVLHYCHRWEPNCRQQIYLSTRRHAAYCHHLLVRSQNCYIRLLLDPSCLSVRLSIGWNGTTRLPTKGFSQKLIFWVFFENISKKFKLHFKLTKITGTLHKDHHTFLTYLAQVLLEREMFRAKFVDQIKTPILWWITPPPRKSCRLWHKVEKYSIARDATNDNIIRRMRFACWMTKART